MEEVSIQAAPVDPEYVSDCSEASPQIKSKVGVKERVCYIRDNVTGRRLSNHFLVWCRMAMTIQDPNPFDRLA